jgi:hypothetical protein
MKDERPDLRKGGRRESTFSEFVGKATTKTFTSDELKSLMDLARKAGCISRDKEVDRLKEAINSIVYNDDGVLKIGVHGDTEVPEIVYKALGIYKP